MYYDVRERVLSVGETIVIDPADGMRAFAVVSGEAVYDSGDPITLNAMVDLAESAVSVRAITECTLMLGVQVE